MTYINENGKKIALLNLQETASKLGIQVQTLSVYISRYDARIKAEGIALGYKQGHTRLLSSNDITALKTTFHIGSGRGRKPNARKFN